MQQVTIEQAKINLTVIVEAALKGEEIIIEEDEKAVKLVPFQTKKPRLQFGSAKGKIEVPDDFNEPLFIDFSAIEDGDNFKPNDIVS